MKFSYLDATLGRRESVAGIVSRLPAGKPRNHDFVPVWNNWKIQIGVLHLTTLSKKCDDGSLVE
jgi:hypothetical protein